MPANPSRAPVRIVRAARLLRPPVPLATVLSIAAAALLAGCASDGDDAFNDRPAFVFGEVATTAYDGASDDLLTAGLGAAGLAGAAPALSATPTAAELRRLAIHTNYRALVDMTSGGGYGSLYGPNVDAAGNVGPVSATSGRIAGSETIAFADDGGSGGTRRVTMMVQVPASFDPARPCIVTAASSGSRGVYGAIGTAGDWGLKRGCAVAYSDKGSGNGVHDLAADTVNLIDGRRAAAAQAGDRSNFTAPLTEAQRVAYNAATPNRFAVKHAHSKVNPEADWGRHTLQAVEFAFYVLNERYAPLAANGRRLVTITPENTTVVASSVSNGAGASLAAAEQDARGWIDGVAVSEPNVQAQPLPNNATGTIQRGSRPAYTGGARPLYDYFSYANLLQPCAALATAAAGSPFAFAGANATLAANRCTALAANGFVSGATTQAQADDALSRLQAHGWEADQNLLQASHWQFATPAIAVTYANAYGRFGVEERVCGISFGAVDGTGAPAAAPAAAVAGLFGTGNGVPPSGAVTLVNDGAAGGARLHTLATSTSTSLPDFGFDAARCLRELWTGSSAAAGRVKAGVAEVQRSANLRGKPTIIVHGRNDTLIPANFSSRPYVLRNAVVEGSASRLSYVEVSNAQHFDAFLGFPGYDARYVPLHVYFVRAMDAMWAHLRQGTPLPPSQLVRTTPRGAGTPVPALTAAALPPIAATPAAADRISVDGTTLRLPD